MDAKRSKQNADAFMLCMAADVVDESDSQFKSCLQLAFESIEEMQADDAAQVLKSVCEGLEGAGDD